MIGDQALVRRVRRGSEAAAETLLRRHWPRAWRAAYAVLGDSAAAEDAAQGAAERAFRKLDQFDDSRPFGPWLARIAVNQALNAVRSRKEEVPLDGVATASDPYGEILDRDEVFSAVAGLSDERRLVVVLRYWADLSPTEIAEALDIPIGTVTSRLARALAELRGTFEEVKYP
jgi:RNA polymerase sigma-70 factor (ECF subfamily)